MPTDFDIKAFFTTNRRKFLWLILLFWVIFALLIFAEDALAMRITGQRAKLVDNLQYGLRWVLWTLLTPVIIFLAIRYPIRKKHLFIDIPKHFLFAVLLVAVEFFLEVPIIQYATRKIIGQTPPLKEYAFIFILKLNIYLLLYFLFVGATYLILSVEQAHRSSSLAKEAELKSQQLQTQLAEAKLRLLQMQLDPHFLFNTHHSIISLMMNDENEKAIRMLTRLSDLLRLSLGNQQPTIPLEDDIRLLKLYLEIQAIRFSDRLHIVFELEPASLSKKVPSFILQPLAENAIKHAVSVSSSVTTIAISSSLQPGQLVLRVENTGSSFDSDSYSEGIGISNTKQRLQQLYNGGSSFEIRDNGKQTVQAIIIIPTN